MATPKALSLRTIQSLTSTRPLLQSCPRISLHPSQCRTATATKNTGTSENAAKYRRKANAAGSVSTKKKSRNHYLNHDLSDMEQFSLCDAMRYIRAFEVGYHPTSPKYELHVKLRTLKNGPVVRNRLRLPHPLRTDLRICVLIDPESPQAEIARAGGAAVVGLEHVIEQIKAGNIDFDRCIAHTSALPVVTKSGVARILGPRGLMPSIKLGTVVKDVRSAVQDMVGASEYREREGVVHMAIGQLGFTPEEMQRNIQAFINSVRKDMGMLSDRIVKDLHEVVLSSTHGPGLSLNGQFRSQDGVQAKDLAVEA